VIILMVGGGLLFVVRQARSVRAMAQAERARAAEIDARVRVEIARSEAEARKAEAGGAPGQDEAKPADPAANDALRKSLDDAAAKLEAGSLKADPAAAASLHSALGNSYLGLGDLDAAEKHLTAALVLRIQALGENDPEVAKDRENLAKVAAAKTKR
jgi:hypothetical protein